jgi:hypothetical protein
MSEIMLIAPGEPGDRQWFPKSYALRFVRRILPTCWGPEENPPVFNDSRHIGRATFRRYQSPGWKIMLGFFVDDALCIGSVDGPIIPTGYVLPGLIQGRALESLPLMHWKLNKRQDRWELWPAGGEEYVATVTQEFMDYAGRVRTQEVVTAQYRVPLPDEAWWPKVAPWVSMPTRSVQEVITLLDSANEREDES